MQGDFTRDTFDPQRPFRRVLLQQGRVMLDADFNEQAAILLHYLQTLAADLIGWHGGPGDGFKIDTDGPRGFRIHPGHYYVEGLLCENESGDVTYLCQPHLPLTTEQEKLEKLFTSDSTVLAYLDVWERHISFVEDASQHPGAPGIREVALGGPDTASRSQLVWQVKCVPVQGKDMDTENLSSSVLEDLKNADKFRSWLDETLQASNLNKETHCLRSGTGRLRARTYSGPPPSSDGPCITPPNAGYRGDDNRLYRVEIHRPSVDESGVGATFKWSRENGSVIFPIRAWDKITALLESLGRDDRSGLQKGDWVELLDDDLVLRNQRGRIYRVESIDLQARRVSLAEPTSEDTCVMMRFPQGNGACNKHPFLRRWDHRPHQSPSEPPRLANDNALELIPGTDNGNWLTLEDGVQVQFEAGTYRSGDYWLIPARAATGNVEWSTGSDGPKFLSPHGVKHFYAPLAIVRDMSVTDLRRKIKALDP